MRSLKSWLGAKHRRRLTRMEKTNSVKANAHELARNIYAMLHNGTEYLTKSLDDFTQESRDLHLVNLTRRAMQPAIMRVRR